MKKSSAILIIIVIIVLAVGAFALTRKSNNKSSTSNATSSSTTSTTPSTSNTSAANSAPASASDLITYSSSGFSPSTLTVKAGTTVTIKNTDSEEMQFNSDPHPVHTDDPDLNVGVVPAGQSKTFTVNKKGTFGYHNHLNPSEKGTIIIQ